MTGSGVRPGEIAATGPSEATGRVLTALRVLRRLDLTPADLLAADVVLPPIPTFGQYIPEVEAAMVIAPSTRVSYRTYYRKLLAYEWGDRRIDQPTVTELRTFVEWCRTTRAVRRSDRNGAGTAIHCVTALRYLYARAVEEKYLFPEDDPSAALVKPRQLPSNRRALPEELLARIVEATANTGDDPRLDSLLLRLHLETACRLTAARRLRPQDLDPDQCLIMLREKGGVFRWQPVSPTLMTLLCQHGDRHSVPPQAQLLRLRNGAPMSRNRYQYWWTRLGTIFPTVQSQGITTHWLRHTTLRWVDRNFGPAVAKAYAGHTDGFRSGSTGIYTRAGMDEIVEALVALSGEPHPLSGRTGGLSSQSLLPSLVRPESRIR
ncbi:tyrosine-type recombinase/integrase [Nocardia sp. alder85J]|uniref:tyrosine-type recombinase/integrase n=1 Tax=Nocardia sp. alder85J TaxID=2862949 RepID=UPI001CD2E614|nr:site-specific integrase [Nocardia sp. alder85J]MCX4097787.1 site-specific integrase [Nocardia sp. alder85J]